MADEHGVTPVAVIRLTLTEFSRLSVREWGLPTGLYPGRMWRDGVGRVWMVVPRGDDRVRVVAARWERVPHRRLSVFPAGWIDHARAYLRQWPGSAPTLWSVSRG